MRTVIELGTLAEMVEVMKVMILRVVMMALVTVKVSTPGKLFL